METEPVDLTGQIVVPFRPVFDGTYSRIYKGKLNEAHVAVKVLKVVSKSTKTTRRKIMRERGVWARMNCPNILPFYGFADDEDFEPFGALISPWCENGDLERYLEEREFTPKIEERVRLFQGIVNGVVYLHTQGVVHGDLKPTNVLLSDQLIPLICDFGLSRICSADGDRGMTTTSEHTGTVRYLAPEIVLSDGEAIPTMASDVWAMGCVGLRVIFLRIPYDHQPNNIHGQISVEIKRGILPCKDIELSYDHEQLLWNLLTRCWVSNPRTRGPASLIQQLQPLLVGPFTSESQPLSLRTEAPSLQMGPHISLPTFDGHPDRPVSLNNLIPAYKSRFERMGGLKVLDKAISRLESGVYLTPNGHPDKPARLNNLGVAYQTRFEHLGGVEDLEKAISTLQMGVDLTPNGHPDKPARLNNLGVAHQIQFKHLGRIEDLERAISMLQMGVDLTPNGHPDQPARLNDLGVAHRTRFEYLGQVEDLEKSTSTLEMGLDLMPDGHPDKPARLNNLGFAYRTRFERFGRHEDLEKAISMLELSVDLTPDDHSNKPAYLSNLGVAYRTRFEHLGRLEDLENAISWLEKGVDLTPNDHLNKPEYLNNLGIAYKARFERFGRAEDLENANSRLESGVN